MAVETRLSLKVEYWPSELSYYPVSLCFQGNHVSEVDSQLVGPVSTLSRVNVNTLRSWGEMLSHDLAHTKQHMNGEERLRCDTSIDALNINGTTRMKMI
jgi:hypothetical protein